MEPPLVSVVIVTWNRKDDVLAAVRSVYDQAYQHVEIIVVDNASTDGTVEALGRDYPSARVVALAENQGAAGGRNAGIRAARGDVVFILDSDACLHRDTLGKVVEKLEAEPTVAVIMCKILSATTGQLDPAAGWIYPENTRADEDLEFASYSFSECGAAIRRSVLDRVGLFWDLLFFVGEGDELSLRVWDAGYKVIYWPEAVVYHRASPSERTTSGAWQYYDLRNSLYIHLVHYPWWMLIVFSPLQIGISLVKAARGGHLRSFRRALVDVARRVPELLRRRRPIRGGTAWHYLRLQREHGPLSWDVVSWLKYKVEVARD